MDESKPPYRTVSLPHDFYEEIKAFIESHPEFGFTSVTEFVKYSIRAYIEFRQELATKRGNEEGGLQ